MYKKIFLAFLATVVLSGCQLTEDDSGSSDDSDSSSSASIIKLVGDLLGFYQSKEQPNVRLFVAEFGKFLLVDASNTPVQAWAGKFDNYAISLRNNEFSGWFVGSDGQSKTTFSANADQSTTDASILVLGKELGNKLLVDAKSSDLLTIAHHKIIEVSGCDTSGYIHVKYDAVTLVNSSGFNLECRDTSDVEIESIGFNIGKKTYVFLFGQGSNTLKIY